MAPLVIACANCSGQLTVPPEILGKLVKCPLCKIVFTAPPSPTTPALLQDEPRGEKLPREPRVKVPPPRDDAVPSLRKPLYAGDDDDAPRRRRARYDEDDDDRDRPSRRGSWYGRYEDDDDEFDRMRRPGRSDLDKAESAVAGPAICLMVIGALIVLIGLFFLFASMGRNTPDGRVFSLLFSFVGLCWGGFIVFGGVMMKNLKSYGLAMAASIMVCINHPCFILHLALGIWAIVVLNEPEVKRAFRWKSGQ